MGGPSKRYMATSKLKRKWETYLKTVNPALRERLIIEMDYLAGRLNETYEREYSLNYQLRNALKNVTIC